MTREEWIRAEIEKAKRRIETFQAMIAEWELELGGARNWHEAPPTTSEAQKKGASNSDDPLAALPPMIFFGKSQTEASRLLLDRVGYPLKTAILLTGIEKGGVKVGGKNETAKKQNLYTILNRSSEFGRAARDTWGLSGWPGIKGKVNEEGELGPTENSAETDPEQKGGKR